MAMEYKTRTDFGVVVPPRSGNDIETIARDLRKGLGLSDEPYFPIIELYDLLHVLIQGAYYEVKPKSDMGNNHGLTLIKKKVIYIRDDVFDAACRGDGFGRFTMCHELGHLLLHRGGIALQRASARPPLYMSSEWQSDRFAGALLMPDNCMTYESTPSDVMQRFGVSYSAAMVRMQQIGPRKTKGIMK